MFQESIKRSNKSLIIYYLTFFNVDIYNSFMNIITNLNRLNMKMKKEKRKKKKKKKKEETIKRKNHHNNGH